MGPGPIILIYDLRAVKCRPVWKARWRVSRASHSSRYNHHRPGERRLYWDSAEHAQPPDDSCPTGSGHSPDNINIHHGLMHMHWFNSAVALATWQQQTRSQQQAILAVWFEPGSFCAWVQHANHSATEPPTIDRYVLQAPALSSKCG